MGQERAKTFIDALHRLEEATDVEPIASLYAEDADISNPVTRHEHSGPDGAREFWSAYRGTFEEIRSDFHNVLENGDTAVLEWTSRGRAADGRDIQYSGVSVVEWDGERISSFRAYFDSRHLGEQLMPGGGGRG
jgi:ketosteroid isomerase-like protein